MKKFFIILFFPLSLLGWWDLGHMTVAKIAYDHMTFESRKNAEAILQCDEYPETNEFITAACWLDDINQETNLFRKLHIQPAPYDPNHILSNSYTAKNSSIVNTIASCCSTLKNPNARPMMKNISLRILIHIVGDLHMPLHVIDLYSEQFPKGDMGGSLFKIKAPHCDNLHAYWDSMCGLSVNRLDRPLNCDGRKEVEKTASLCTQFPCHSDTCDGTVENWIEQTRGFAPFVYTTPMGQTPSVHYQEKGQQICMHQIALAGYRLAHLLNACLQ